MYIIHILYKHFYHGFTVDFLLSFEFVCVCLCVCARVCVRARESVFSHHVSHFYLFFTLHILYSQHIFMYCLSLPISCALYILLPLGLRGMFVSESVFICATVSCFLCACAVFNNDSMLLFVSAVFSLPSVSGAYPLLSQNYPFTVVWCARAVPFKSWQ